MKSFYVKILHIQGDIPEDPGLRNTGIYFIIITLIEYFLQLIFVYLK